MTIPYRPLAHIREAVNELGLDVTYAFEDLIYIEHNAFLLQMGERGELVNLYFNQDSSVEERGPIAQRLQHAGEQRELQILRKGTYRMTPAAEENNIEIEFFDGVL